MMIRYILALAVLLILGALISWAFIPARYMPGNRVRYLRLRLRLRQHPGKGFAGIGSLWLRWGRLSTCGARSAKTATPRRKSPGEP
jgi:hypothetical protein